MPADLILKSYLACLFQLAAGIVFSFLPLSLVNQTRFVQVPVVGQKYAVPLVSACRRIPKLEPFFVYRIRHLSRRYLVSVRQASVGFEVALFGVHFPKVPTLKPFLPVCPL